MKLIIDISEDLYRVIKAIQSYKPLTEEEIAIANGIPLDNVRAKNDELKDARDILDNYKTESKV